MIPKINSAHGAETRNIINRVIEVLNQQGKSLQDLVAEGQLTPSQYFELITAINGLIKSGHVDKSDLTPEFKGEIERFNSQLAQKATKEELDTKVAAVADGSPKGTYPTLADLENSYPSGDSGVYVVTADGNWYYWNGTAWKAGGAYQSTGIAKRSVDPKKTTFFIIGKNLFNKDAATVGYYLNGYGELVAHENYAVSEFIEVEPNTQYSWSGYANRIVWYDDNQSFISTISQPTTQTDTSPANAAYFRYNFSKSELDIQQFEEGSTPTSYEPYFGSALDVDKIRDKSIPVDKLQDSPFETYDPSEIFVDMHPDSIKFYIKGGNSDSNKYLKYELKHESAPFDPTGTETRSNFDVWRLYEVYVVSRTGQQTFADDYAESVVNNGEWECALKEVGQPDFMGGSTHGDEVLNAAHVLFDGVRRELGTTDKFTCRNIKFVQKSQLYRVFTQTPVANYLKVYDITASQGIKLYQTVEWIESIMLDAPSYLTMLPIKRTLHNSPETQITDHFYRDSDYDIKDVSTTALVKSEGASTWVSGIKVANIWGENSGISAEVTILKRPEIPSERMQVANVDAYNKLYFDIIGVDYNTTVGEVMEMETIFKLNITV